MTRYHKTRRKSPEHFFEKQTNINHVTNLEKSHEKYWIFMSETESKYDKQYIIFRAQISAFSHQQI